MINIPQNWKSVYSEILKLLWDVFPYSLNFIQSKSTDYQWNLTDSNSWKEFTVNQSNFTDYFSENWLIWQWNIFLTDESVKRQITDSISENLTDSDLESKSKRSLLKLFNLGLSVYAIFWVLYISWVGVRGI